MSNVPYRLVPLLEAIKLTDGLTPIYADTETIGLYGEVRLLQVFHPDLPEVLMVERPCMLTTAAWLRSVKSIWHSAHYDISTVSTQLGRYIDGIEYEDTFLLARLHYSDKLAFSLDAVMEYTIGYDPYEEQGLDKKELQKSDWQANMLTPEQLTYAATDVYYLPNVYEAVKHKESEISYTLDKLTLGYCLKFQWNGMPLDQHRIAKKKEEVAKEIEVMDMPINVNSYKQVRPWLGVTESTAYDLMLKYLQGGENADKARDVVKARKLLKLQSFLKGFNGERYYGYFKPSARSGRLTSDKHNLQQIPWALKGMFTAPPGRVFVYSDFAQLELRCACVIAMDRKMEAAFRMGKDLHGVAAEEIFGADYTKIQREIAKQSNFNLLYGGGAAMLGSILVDKAELLLSIDDLEKIKSKWLRTWEGIARWQKSRKRDHYAGRLGSTPYGREYKSKLMTDFMNIEVQGFGAEVSKLALHYLHPQLVDYNAILCNYVHDNYITECDDDPEVYEAVAKVQADAMQKAWFESTKHMEISDLPMPVEIKVGYNWLDIEQSENLVYRLEQ